MDKRAHFRGVIEAREESFDGGCQRRKVVGDGGATMEWAVSK